jgi:Na+-translocating ferredoxin:NAD+ oxidoreductase subunit G
MAKLQSNIKNMVLSLFVICSLMAVALGYVYSITKDPIEASKKKSEIDALKLVLPEFDNDPFAEPQDFNGITIYTGKKKDSVVGYAVKTYSEKGYGGKITLIAGFLPDGHINKIAVLEHKETPGLGSNMSGKFKDQFFGKNPSEFILKVKKDGGDVDAITASTITSRAFCDAVEKAYTTLAKNVLKIEVKNNCGDTCNISSIAPLKAVMPVFDNNPLANPIKYGGIEVYTGIKNKIITGYAVKSFANGFNGPVWILAGFTPDGTIKDTYILSSKESAGYGSHLSDSEFRNQFIQKNPGKYKVAVKADEGDVDAIAGATISSRAFCDALSLAYETLSKNVFIKTTSDTVKKSEEPKIDTSKLAAMSFLKSVLPDFSNNPRGSVRIIDGLEIYTAKKNNTVVGYAVKSSTKGYNGIISLLVGFTTSGTINNIAVISHNESKGMGAEINEDYFREQFLGKNPATEEIAVKEDNGIIDAISGSTISSRAYCKAVKNAFNAYKKVKGK